MEQQPYQESTGNLSFKISFFKNKSDNKPTLRQLSFDDLCEMAAKPTIRAGKDGKLFAPATFEPAVRKKENAKEMSFVGFDFDSTTTFEHGVARAVGLGHQFVAYTTYSHLRVTDDHPEPGERFRIIFPLLEPIPADLYPALWKQINNQFEELPDPAAKSKAQMFYTPAKASADAPYEYEINTGPLLDWRALNLEQDLKQEPKAPTPPAQTKPHTSSITRTEAYVRAAVEEELSNVRTATHPGRNNNLNKAAFALGQLLHLNVVTRAEIKGDLEQAAIACGLDQDVKGGGIDGLRATIRSGLDAGEGEPRSLPPETPHSSKRKPDSKPEEEAAVAVGDSLLLDNLDLELTDQGNAERLMRRWRPVFRYDQLNKVWMHFTGKQWRGVGASLLTAKAVDEAKALYKLASAREIEPEAARRIGKFATASLKASSLRDVLTLAQHVEGAAIDLTEFDRSPHFLNCANGVLNLATGEVQEHQAELLLSKITSVAYDPTAKADLWERFLDRVFAGDTDLIAAVQEYVGYTLTADTSAQCLFVAHGGGANGKSVFAHVLKRLAGEYGQAIRTETLTDRRSTGASNDLAALRGARLAIAQETERTHKLAQSLVKQLTGGDEVTARFLFREYFSYEPAFKIWLLCNHKPQFDGTDYAMQRRLKLIPFLVTIPEEERDRDLTAKLDEELPGILAWAVEGAQRWLTNRKFTEARAVVAATADYISENDHFSSFADDCLVLRPGVFAKGFLLMKAYEDWCAENREKPLRGRAYQERLLKLPGVKKKNRNDGKYWENVGIKQVETI